MSKSLGNYIGVAEAPEQIYGKIMSVPDSLLMDYFELLTDVHDAELKEFKEELDSATANPMTLKKRLAREIITQLYDLKTTAHAEEHFERTVQRKEIPEEIAECRLSFRELCPPSVKVGIDLSKLLVATGQAKSRAEANRLIAQGAVSIDGEKVIGNIIEIQSGCVVRAGKRRFARVIDIDVS